MRRQEARDREIRGPPPAAHKPGGNLNLNLRQTLTSASLFVKGGVAMKRRLALIAAITVSAVLSLGIRVPRCAAQATLLEFSDESLGFANEIFTNVSVLPTTTPPNPLGGTQIYSKTFFKTVGVQSIKIDWNCTGDDHGGVSEGLRAQLDGVDCNPPGTVD